MVGKVGFSKVKFVNLRGDIVKKIIIRNKNIDKIK